MYRKSGFVSFIWLLILFIGLVAEPVPAKPLQIWVASHTDGTYYGHMVDLYKEKVDPKFEAEVHAFGFTEMPDKLAMAMKTGVNTPDIVQLDEIFFSIYLHGEVPFVDLTQRIKKAKLESAILEQRMDLFKYGGKYYGIPQSVSAVVLYYREDLLGTAGIGPTELDTWDKFIKSGKKIASETTGLLAMDWSYLEILVRQRGFDLYDENGMPQLTSKPVVETLEFLVNLEREGVGVHPDRGHIFDPTFFSGDVANEEITAIIGAAWYGLDMIQGFAPDLKGKWKAMPLPAWTDKKSKSERRTSTFSGEGLLIYKDSKEIDKSWDFIRFVNEDREANVQRYLQGNCFTAYKPAWLDPRLSKPEPYFGGQSVAGLMGELAPHVPPVKASPYKAMLVNLLREKYWSALMLDEMTPKQALEEIQAELTRKR